MEVLVDNIILGINTAMEDVATLNKMHRLVANNTLDSTSTNLAIITMNSIYRHMDIEYIAIEELTISSIAKAIKDGIIYIINKIIEAIKWIGNKASELLSSVRHNANDSFTEAKENYEHFNKYFISKRGSLLAEYDDAKNRSKLAIKDYKTLKAFSYMGLKGVRDIDQKQLEEAIGNLTKNIKLVDISYKYTQGLLNGYISIFNAYSEAANSDDPESQDTDVTSSLIYINTVNSSLMEPMLEVAKHIKGGDSYGYALPDYSNGEYPVLVYNKQKQWKILLETAPENKYAISFNYLDPEGLNIIAKLVKDLAKTTYNALDNSADKMKSLHKQAEDMQDIIEPLLKLEDIPESSKENLETILNALFYVTKFLISLNKVIELHIDTIDYYNRFIGLHKPFYHI